MNGKTGLLVAGAALALLACGNDGDGKGGKLPGPRPGAVSADLERYARGICNKAIACGYGEGDDVDECTASLLNAFCDAAYASVTLPGLDGCLATFTCEVFAGAVPVLSDACDGVSRAMLEAQGFTVAEPGGTCSPNYAAGGSICSNGDYCSAGDGAACGTCVARKAAGEACASALECASFYCAEDATCHARLADGEPCEDDLQCLNLGCIEGTCGGEASGGTCASSDDCSGSEFCLEGTCVPPRADGAACTDDEQCSDVCMDGACAPFAACGAGEVGEPCDSSDNCQEGLLCSAETDRCIAAVAIGDTCRGLFASDCAQGSYCEVEDFSTEQPTGTCTALKPDGADCTVGSECESGACSDAGTCETPALCGGTQRRRARLLRPAPYLPSLPGLRPRPG
jgi:hypothetical protein